MMDIARMESAAWDQDRGHRAARREVPLPPPSLFGGNHGYGVSLQPTFRQCASDLCRVLGVLHRVQGLLHRVLGVLHRVRGLLHRLLGVLHRVRGLLHRALGVTTQGSRGTIQGW